ncbi:MAG: hypothetical protein CMN86_07870 [Stappia sp.]|nr:hypothetical protein [Stappia sp.]
MGFADWGKSRDEIARERRKLEEFERNLQREAREHQRKLHEKRMEEMRKSSELRLKQWRLAQRGIYYEEL